MPGGDIENTHYYYDENGSYRRRGDGGNERWRHPPVAPPVAPPVDPVPVDPVPVDPVPVDPVPVDPVPVPPVVVSPPTEYPIHPAPTPPGVPPPVFGPVEPPPNPFIRPQPDTASGIGALAPNIMTPQQQSLMNQLLQQGMQPGTYAQSPVAPSGNVFERPYAQGGIVSLNRMLYN